jgi:hypothetical protein
MKKFILITLIFLSLSAFSDDYKIIENSIKNSKYPEAIVRIDSMLEKDPRDTRLFDYKGDVFHALGQFEEALKLYRQSLMLAVGNAHIEKLKVKIEKVKSDLYEQSIEKIDKVESLERKNLKLNKPDEKRDFEEIKFDTEFKFQQFGKNIYGPQSFTVSGDEIFVIDNHNFRIGRYDIDGKNKGFFGKYGKTDGGLFRPVDIVLDNDGNIYVADMGEVIRYIKFSNSGKVILEGKTNILNQIDSMIPSSQGFMVSGISSEVRKSFSVSPDLLNEKNIPDIYGDGKSYYGIDTILGRIHLFDKEGRLQKIYIVEYPERTVAWSMIYGAEDYAVFTARYVKSQVDNNFEFNNAVYVLKNDVITHSFYFDSSVFGNIYRTKNYFYDNKSSYLYIPSIKENNFRILKFKVF